MAPPTANSAYDPARDARLQALIARLVERMRPEAILLFGSYARGDFTPDSDYDLLVIVPDDTPAERRSLDFAHASKRGLGVAADVIPCRRSVFAAKKHDVGTLSHIAANEGIAVYVR